MVRTNQGGSVLSFIIIGTVMTLLLLGGIYIVRQQVGIGASVPAPTQPQAPTSGDDSPNPSDEETASEQPDKEPPVATPVVPREEEKPTATPPAATEVVPQENAQLPQTGNAETFGFLLGAVLLTLASVSYVQSRNRLRSSL